MKKFLLTMLILAATSISGYSADIPQIKNALANPARIFEDIKPYVLADDNFSNLQLAEIDKPVYDKYEVDERQNLGLTMNLPEVAPYHEENIAYLTFDDGPDDKVTPQILNILKRENVKATFFVCGNMIEQNPKVLQRIFNEGHAIGNHSYNHDYAELYKSPYDFIEQFTKTDEIIKKYTGVRPLIIRAPGGTAGAFNADYWAMVEDCGYVEYDWNISTEDATASVPNAAAQVKNVAEQIGNDTPASLIILMHSKAGKEETAKALPKLIQLLRNKGYKFGVITPMTPQPW